MSFEVWADPGFDKELSKFNKAQRDRIEAGLKAYARNPIRHPKATRLGGASIVQSFRLRIGPFRVLGTLFVSQKLILVTTVFQKKRDTDYDAAMHLHETRLAAQVPPISEYLDDLGF
jgi:mRNA-degrading endonuclease RelE of RelBE toxin-antitoxin system